MNFEGLPQKETKFEKVKRVVDETLWIVGTSLFVLAFPIYAAVKL